jgi:hypothetical protein
MTRPKKLARADRFPKPSADPTTPPAGQGSKPTGPSPARVAPRGPVTLGTLPRAGEGSVELMAALMRGRSLAPADWSFWSQVTTAELWQAVMLSLDLQPVRGPFTAPAKLVQRLAIAVDHVGSGLLRTHGRADPLRSKVLLAQFAAWAQSLPSPWRLPGDFPRRWPGESREGQTAEPKAQRLRRLRAEHEELKGSGHPAPTKELAKREGVHPSRIRQLLQETNRPLKEPVRAHPPFGVTPVKPKARRR